MRGNRRRDTAPELALRRILHKRGLRYRVDYRVPFDRRRTIDIAFPRQRIAVFVDGCFWHGCEQHTRLPKTNADFWLRKLHVNAERDRQITQRLHGDGWTVLRFWEHDDPTNAATMVAEAVRSARSANGHQPGQAQHGPSGG